MADEPEFEQESCKLFVFTEKTRDDQLRLLLGHLEEICSSGIQSDEAQQGNLQLLEIISYILENSEQIDFDQSKNIIFDSIANGGLTKGDEHLEQMDNEEDLPQGYYYQPSWLHNNQNAPG